MKPKVAFFDMASCEGCQLALLNCEEIFLNILDLVDIVEFREAIRRPRCLNLAANHLVLA